MIFVTNYSKEKCKNYKSFQDQALLKESILMYAQQVQATEQVSLHDVRYCSCSLGTINGKFYYQDQILEKPLL